MTSFGMVRNVIQTYPETSPFKLKCPVFNLLPVSDPGETFDTDDVRHACLAIARAHNGHNVFANTYGTNPLPLDDKALLEEVSARSWDAYTQPPPLQRVELHEFTELSQILDADEHAVSVLANSNEWSSPRLLKIVSGYF